jgi:hypothetical protein
MVLLQALGYTAQPLQGELTAVYCNSTNHYQLSCTPCMQILVPVQAAASAAQALQGELPTLLGGQRVSDSGSAGRRSGA